MSGSADRAGQISQIGQADQISQISQSGQSGQSLVETVAAIPVLLLCALIGLQGLAYGAAWVQADSAAHAAAIAAQTGGNADRAARSALPGWSRGKVRVRHRSGRVDVWLSPRAFLPPLAVLGRAHATARFAKVVQ